MKSRLHLLVVCVSFLMYRSNAQEVLKLSAEVYKSYDELKSAYENLDKVQNIVKEIEKGNKPDVAKYGRDWAPLVKNYKKAAETIRNSKLVTDFDATPYSVSINDLNNCYIKDQNFGKLRSYKSQLDAAVVRGQSELKKLTDYKKLIEQTFAALKYLIEVNAKLSSVPIYNQLFQWNWFDLETGVKPVLGELSSAVNQQERKLRTEIEKINLQASNLSNNINLLENSICLINGVYRGNFPYEGGTVRISLTINKNGEQYNGTLTDNLYVKTVTQNIAAITIKSNRYISFTISGDESSTTYSGELSSDFKEIRNFKVSGHDFSVTLRK